MMFFDKIFLCRYILKYGKACLEGQGGRSKVNRISWKYFKYLWVDCMKISLNILYTTRLENSLLEVQSQGSKVKVTVSLTP